MQSWGCGGSATRLIKPEVAPCRRSKRLVRWAGAGCSEAAGQGAHPHLEGVHVAALRRVLDELACMGGKMQGNGASAAARLGVHNS